MKESRLPVILLSGFLGSGKTTWLRNILAEEDLGETAVLINEFGEVGIDHLVVETISPDVVLLDSGCLCCQIQGELKEAILNLITSRETGKVAPFKKIIIETTGLANPMRIFSTLLMDTVLRNQIYLYQVLVTADALNGMEIHSQQEEWHAQIASAGCILVTKTDLVSQEQVDTFMAYLSNMNPVSFVYNVREVNLHQILEQKPHDMTLFLQSKNVEQVNHVGDNTQSLSFFLDNEINWESYAVWLSALIHTHGNKLLRVKNLLHTTQYGTLLIDGVGHTLHQPRHINSQDTKDKRSRFVFITRGMDVQKIALSFKEWIG